MIPMKETFIDKLGYIFGMNGMIPPRLTFLMRFSSEKPPWTGVEMVR